MLWDSEFYQEVRLNAAIPIPRMKSILMSSLERVTLSSPRIYFM